MPNNNIPSEGVVRISKVQGDRTLFDSPFKHPQYISIEIFSATIQQDLNDTKVFHKHSDRLFKLSLSASQFAQMITTLNQEQGTSCTVDYIVDKEVNPLKPKEKEKDLAELKIDETTKDILQSIKDLRELISDTKMSQKAQRSLENQVGKLERELNDRLPHIANMYREYLEQVDQQSKTEFVAWLEMNYGNGRRRLP
jgi:hypothetical protein